jgi:hypothetical protein
MNYNEAELCKDCKMPEKPVEKRVAVHHPSSTTQRFIKYLDFEMRQLITLIQRKDSKAEKKALYILKQIKNLGK